MNEGSGGYFLIWRSHEIHPTSQSLRRGMQKATKNRGLR